MARLPAAGGLRATALPQAGQHAVEVRRERGARALPAEGTGVNIAVGVHVEVTLSGPDAPRLPLRRGHIGDRRMVAPGRLAVEPALEALEHLHLGRAQLDVPARVPADRP